MSSHLPDAAVAAPQVTLTAENLRRGEVARLQAEACERYGPVVRGNVPTGPDAGPCLFLVGPEIARESMTSRVKAFSSEQGWLPVLGRRAGYATLNTDDPLHAEQRRRWAPALTNGMVQSHWPELEAIIADWLAGLRDGSEFDAYPSLRELAFRTVARTVAGIPESAVIPAFRAICVILDAQTPENESRTDYAQVSNAARDQLEGVLRDVIAERRRHRVAGGSSLLDLLLDYADFPENPDPDDAIRSHLTILLIAGHETGATMFSRAAFILAQQPALAERLARELASAGWSGGSLPISLIDSLPYLNRFQLEVGRLYPSLINLPRVVTEEIEVGDYRIVPGTRVALAIGATQLLSRLFRDPLRFDPERYADPDSSQSTRPFQMLTFAGGSRMCMGLRFAQLEFKAVCAQIATQLELSAVDAEPVPHSGFWNARPGAPLLLRARRRVSARAQHRARPERHEARRRSPGG